MPLRLAHRYAFPEQKPRQVHELYLGDIGSIELAFHEPKIFLQLDRAKICRQIMDARWIDVKVLHLPTIKLDDLDVLSRVMGKAVDMALSLGCRDLVIHPSRTTLDKVRGLLSSAVTPLLVSSGTRLCWETFLGRKRLFYSPSQIAEFAGDEPEAHGICYDTAHMGEHEDVVRELREYLPHIRVIHASNRTPGHKRLHLPIFHPEGTLNFSEILATLRKTNFKGVLVLEYLSDFRKEQLFDYAMLKQL